MRTIYKYDLSTSSHQVLRIPEGYEVLSVQYQRNSLVLWCLVEDTAPCQGVEIRVFGTGHGMADYLSAKNYIGTVQEPGTPWVWHIFHFARPTGATN